MKEEPKSRINAGQRLQVALARFGLASRRGVVRLIEQGKVQVNGRVVLEKGFRVDPAKDQIRVDGEFLSDAPAQKKAYYIFYKPKNVMTTLQDPHAEKTVADYFRMIPERLFPVGRLDRDTTGLLLMTNDGELAFRLTHPKFGVSKRYAARVRGFVSDEAVKRLESGVELEEGMTAPCRIKIEKRDKKQTWLTVTLHEGKKRQIRRIFQKIGHGAMELERLNFGPLSLSGMTIGQKRKLTSEEVASLFEAAGLKKGE
jgi:23S rRNA pseudouridine2605 synthase